MKKYFLVVLLFAICVSFGFNTLLAKGKKKKGGNLPSTISKSLTLKGRKKPYLLNGTMTIEKGATLTLLPGVTIKGNGPKADIRVSGEIKILGKKKSKVRFENIRYCFFLGAKCQLENFYIDAGQTKFEGEVTGQVKNGTITVSYYNKHSSVLISAPKSGMLTFSNVLFKDKTIELMKVTLPDAIKHLKFNKCAFLMAASNVKTPDKYVIRKMPSEMFALGTKCDSLMQIGYNKMDWTFKPVVVSEWYIHDDGVKTTIAGMAKSNKTLKLKLSKKKQTKNTPDKLQESKKKKKKKR